MKIAWYVSQLIESGGGEKFLFEITNELSKQGHEVIILCDVFDDNCTFSNKYKVNNVHQLDLRYTKNPSYIKKAYEKFKGLFSLFSVLKSEKPDLLICQSEYDSIRLFIIHVLLKIPYRLFIFGQMFQFEEDLSKYSFTFKRHLKAIIENQPDYQNALGKKPGLSSPLTFLVNEIISILKYYSVRKSEKVFVLSNQVKWEVSLLYNKVSDVLRGAISFHDIDKKQIRLSNHLNSKLKILSISRLEKKKRVDILIQAFLKSDMDGELTIIGEGGEKKNLQSLVSKSDQSNKVRFLGRVSDPEKDKAIKNCDIFVSLDNSDFVITAIEALAKGKLVLVSEHFDLTSFDGNIAGLRQVKPDIDSVQSEIQNLSTIGIDKSNNLKILETLTWEYVSKEVLR